MAATCDITRTEAQQAILGKIMTATDAELCDAMWALHGVGDLYNFSLVQKYRASDPYGDFGAHASLEWDHATQRPMYPGTGRGYGGDRRFDDGE